MDKERFLEFLKNFRTGIVQGPLPGPTGYASIDKPWLAHYPEGMLGERKEYNKIIDYIKDVWHGYDDDIMLHYYGLDVTAKEFFTKVEDVAKSLKAYGLKKGDTIITNLESVPEFIYLFFAAETIGVNVKNKIGANAQEIAEVITESNAKCFFVHDYMSEEESNCIYNNTSLKNIVVINPLEHTSGNKTHLREHIRECIEKKYTGVVLSSDKRNIGWEEFVNNGNTYEGEVYVESDDETKLFSAYTSGTTGQRKEVIHSSKTIMGMLNQMVFQNPNESSKERETWLWPIYPPSLVAAIVAYLCLPLAQGKKIILDPYFEYTDSDKEMMHYKPNSTGLVPVFIEALIESDRIPEDYDMSHLKVLGFGAESLTRNLIERVEEFLRKHNSKAQLNGGYGSSENGSQVTIAFYNYILKMGSAGIPLLNTIVGIFKPGTDEELGYGEIGEICKSGPGIMMGYSSEEKTKEVLQLHDDGMYWLHSGDYGYMDENGFLFVFGREYIVVYSGEKVFPLPLENKISDIKGVKTAIIVSGESVEHPGHKAPYLFVVPMPGYDMSDLAQQLTERLEPYERPEGFLTGTLPISHFKADRRTIQGMVRKKILKKN